MVSLVDRARRRLAQAAHDDAGFSLTEVIVSLVLIAIVMTAASYFFAVSLHAQTGTKQRQEAVYLADQQLEQIQALPGKHLLDNRSQSAVQSILASPYAASLTSDDITNCPTSATCNYDPTATGTPTVAPTQTLSPINGVTYTVQNYIDPCYRKTVASDSCTAINSAGAQVMYRATVNVYWSAAAGEGCGTSACSYAASTLIDPDSNGDPVFNSNLSHPTITSITPATIAVGASATLTITGTQFLSGATVSIDTGGGTFGTISSNSGTQIVVPFTASSGAAPGSTYAIYVTNPDGGRTTGYNITLVANPTISVSPSSVVASSSTSITITGTDLQTGATLRASRGTISNLSIQSTTKATATYTAPATAGTDTFTWKNAAAADDQGVATATETVTAPAAPTVTSASPTSLTAGSRTTVTVSGSNLTSLTGANWGGGTCTVSASNGSSATLSCTAGSTAGTFNLSVTNAGGTSGNVSLAVTAAPTVTSLCSAVYNSACSSTTFRSGATDTFYVLGTNFSSGAQVSLVANGQTYYNGPATVDSQKQLHFAIYVPSTGGAYYVSATVTVTQNGITATKTVTVYVQ